jgi:signal transduction histidine kinase
MKSENKDFWLFMGSFGLMTAIFLTEVLSPLGLPGTVAYVLLLFHYWWRQGSILRLRLLLFAASLFLVFGYFHSNFLPANALPMGINRLLALLAIWMLAFLPRQKQVPAAKEEVDRGELAEALQLLERSNADLHRYIEEREQIQERLINSQGLYSAMAHHFPNGVLGVMNRKGRFLLLDGKEVRNIDFPSENSTAMKHPLLAFLTDENTKALQGVFAGTTCSLVWRNQGQVYQLTAVPLPGVRGHINEVLVVLHNITSQKKMEEGLRKALLREKELGELKSRFVTTASHEFRTPLSTILTSVFILEQYAAVAATPACKAHLAKIKRAVHNLTDVLNDFLSIGKLEEGKVSLEKKEIPLQAFVQELVTETEQIQKPGQYIMYTHQGEDGLIVTDRQLLRHILLNLLSNALKYSQPNGRVELLTALSGRELQITVRDFGIGIPADEVKHIFKRFYRAQNAISREGTGLGLNIIKKYIKLLKGSIRFKSQLNQGTVFYVNLPIGLPLAREITT